MSLGVWLSKYKNNSMMLTAYILICSIRSSFEHTNKKKCVLRLFKLSNKKYETRDETTYKQLQQKYCVTKENVYVVLHFRTSI